MSDDKALHLVLDLREKEEQDALEMWANAKNQVANFQKQIEQLEQFEAIYQNEMEIKSRNTIDMNMYFSYQAFIQRSNKDKN